MGNIVVLDELTINQIAAGEVIERPASVVKELVENSIDAGATSLTVEVQNGGIKKIRISDNGSGISKDDFEFAFERHATSKIRTANDLENVKSMGFRGEALASIAAISNIELVSRTKDDELGNRIILEGGNVLDKSEAGASIGTTITVSNLFYNTPVRYKFLKKDFTELGYIEDAITRIALANPNIAIKLIADNKTVIQTSGNGELITTIYSIYGKEVADGLLNVDYVYEDIYVTGVIGKPEIARNNRSYQQFFVNKRFIKDKTLSSSAEQAFKGILPIGKYGFLVLNLDIEPRKIDVNVHPTKLEIRFQEEQKVFKAIYHAIRESLLKADLVKDVTIPKAEEATKSQPVMFTLENNKPKPIVEPIIQTKKQEEIPPVEEKTHVGLFNMFRKKEIENKEENFIEANTENTIEQIFSRKGKDEYRTPELNSIQEPKQETNIEENIELPKVAPVEEVTKTKQAFDFEEMYKKTFGIEPKDVPQEENTQYQENEEVKDYIVADNVSIFESNEEYVQMPTYKYCGTVFLTYIVIEIKDEMYMIDQHAAHERIMYEKIRKNYYSNNKANSQIMLLPDIINVSHKEKNIIKENAEMFRKAGFIFEEFGDNTIRLIGVPDFCMDLDTKELFTQILDEIGTIAITALQEKEDKFIATVACKAAVKAKMNLTEEEIQHLLEELLILPNPFTCPHGRPTAIKMTKNDLEKKFDRRK